MQKELLETQPQNEVGDAAQPSGIETPSLPSLIPGWILLIATVLSLLYFATAMPGQRNSQAVPQQDSAFPDASTMPKP